MFDAVGAGIAGASITVLSFLVVWFYSAAKNALLRRDTEEALRRQAKGEAVLYDIQSRVARARQAELQADVDRYKEGGINAAVEIEKLKREANQRNALISSLQQRVLNLNEQVNGEYFGGKKSTTLADVKKLTGES